MRTRPLILLFFAILAFCALRFETALTQEIGISAVINSPAGTVEVIKAGKTNPVAAADGMSVGKGDVLRTGAAGNCVLTWTGGHMLRVSALSEISIDNLSINPVTDNENFSLSLKTGKVVANAGRLMGDNSVFEIKTATAIAGVRGTLFSVEYTTDGIANVKCANGFVNVVTTAGETVVLGKGQKAKVFKGEIAGGASKMDDAEKAELGATDFKVPVLEMMEPLGDLETGNSFILFHGRTNPGADVTVNGEKVTVSPDGFFTTIVDLTEGDNKVKVKTTGKSGDKQRNFNIKFKPGKTKGTVTEAPGEWKNQKKASSTTSATGEASSSATATVKAPIEGGTFTIVYPQEGFLTRKSIVTLVGNATPGMTLYINGSELEIPAEKQGFMVEIKLEDEGENKIVVADGKGDSANTATLKVTKDTTPPTLEIIKPIGQFDTKTGDCVQTVSGMARCTIIGLTEPDVFLSINDMRQEVDEDGSFNVEVPVSDDEAVLFIVAEDRAGNRTTRIITRVTDIDKIVNLSITAAPSMVTGVADSSNSQGTAWLTVSGTNLFNMPVDGVTAYLSIFSVSGAEDINSTLSTSAVTISNGSASANFYAGLPTSAATPYTATVRVQNADGTVYDETQITIIPDGPNCPPSMGTWTYNSSTGQWECQ